MDTNLKAKFFTNSSQNRYVLSHSVML